MNLKKYFLILLLISNFLCCESSNPVKIEVETMGIVDIFMNIEEQSAFFTVDTALDFVPLDYPGVALADGHMTADNGKKYFQEGDNFQVLSLGYVLPLSFEIYKVENGGNQDNIAFRMAAIDRLNNVHELLPTDIFMPLPNYEMNLGSYYSKFIVEVTIRILIRHDVSISMIGVNPALQGKIFRVPCFMKVLHNFVLKV